MHRYLNLFVFNSRSCNQRTFGRRAMRNDAPSTPVSAGSCPGAGRLDAQGITTISIHFPVGLMVTWYVSWNRRHPQQSMPILFPGIKIHRAGFRDKRPPSLRRRKIERWKSQTARHSSPGGSHGDQWGPSGLIGMPWLQSYIWNVHERHLYNQLLFVKHVAKLKQNGIESHDWMNYSFIFTLENLSFEFFKVSWIFSE